ncbi:FAD-binding protein [Chryseolinea lacunae]|uniref:FAD-binding protein n=1 Tax=Chryseolinea lacunae TaxID=2801331 RepID=A0ABS1KVD0_9BACT|nr:FAD-binding protein [Chryseolinea lacunae]MBL0743187.1 FAD-binding protein [Chryseolinea lacunae]
MSLASLFLAFQGRIGRATFFLSLVFVWTAFFNLTFFLEKFLGDAGVVILIALLLWMVFALSVKRYHDLGKAPKHLLLLLIPLVGPIWVFLELTLRKGMAGNNRFGQSPDAENLDYATVRPEPTPNTINDVTQINVVQVKEVLTPESVEEVCDIVKKTKGPLSIGGGRFSMGGQVSSPDSTHLDMRKLNKIIAFNALEKRIHVQAGVRWCDIQRTVDNQNLSVKIMQTYANFTVGGSLSVNSHGRYMGLGPLVLSVRFIRVVMPDGILVEASPTVNKEIFYGVVGGYGALAIIVEAELELTENIRVERSAIKLKREEYLPYFKQHIRNSKDAVFHNADIYPPHYTRLRAVTWSKTDAPASSPYRLMPLQRSYPVHRYFYWAFTETLTGKWRREFIVEPLLYRAKKVHWRNYEAGYDVAELEPSSRQHSTYVLQEYFVPIDRFDDFLPLMAAVLRKHKVNVINISVRHALPDPGTYLAWARKEMFAFVLYYKQHVHIEARHAVGQWTRELIDAVLRCDGTYYLPYQPHATPEQFHSAYPRAKELFALKQKLDPDFRLRNVLWDKYYAPTLNQTSESN